MDYSILEKFEEDAPLPDGFQPARNKTAEKQARQAALRETQARALQNLSLENVGKPAAHTQSHFIPARPCAFYQQGKCRYGNACTFAHVSAKQAAEMTSQPRPNGRTPHSQQPWSTMAALDHQAAQSGNKSNNAGGQSEHGLYKTSICTFWHQNKDSCIRGDSCSFAHGMAELRRPHFQRPVQMPFIKASPTALPQEPAYLPAGDQQHRHPSFDQRPLPPRDPESVHSEAFTHHPQPSSAPSSAAAVLPDDEDDVWEMCNDLIGGLTQQRGPAVPHPTVAPLHAPRPYIPGSTAVEYRRQDQPKPAPYSPSGGEASVSHPGRNIAPDDESSARNQQQQQQQPPPQQQPSLPQMSKRQAKKLRQQATPAPDPSQAARYDLLLPREKESDAAETKPQSPLRPPASNAAPDNSNRAAATADNGHAKKGSTDRVPNGTAHHPSAQVNLGFDEEDDIDSSFQCALTLEIMEDPVVCADGHSYERAVIKNWLATHDTSPLTGLTLPHKELVTNRAVKRAIDMRRQPQG